MAQAFDRLFTLEDWAVFEGQPEVRYELIEGRLVAMAPAKSWHGTIAAEIIGLCRDALRDRPPCRALQQPGIEVQRSPSDKVYIPDVAVTCEPPEENNATIKAPRLVVEVLSPSTDHYDKMVKLPDYMSLPTVEEIWLVWSESRVVLVAQRANGGPWPDPKAYIAKASFESGVLGAHVSLDDIYRFVPLRKPEPIDPSEEPPRP